MYEIMKICIRCQQELDKSQFSKDKKQQDNLNTWCKDCAKKYNKDYYIKNKEKLKKYAKNYTKNNKIAISNNKKEYYENNKDNKKKYDKEYNKTHKKERNEYIKNRKQNDINYRILCNLRGRLLNALKRNSKKSHSKDLLGCSIEEFKAYIEAQFTEGMNWENYGTGNDKWNLDHIIPCSSFKHLDTLLEQQLCFHYSNYQPLWEIENKQKSDKIIGENNK
jgi:hypothetical protein